MNIGALVRRMLGPRLFPWLGRIYRSIFIDLEKVSAALPALPERSTLLDIGGGDGELLNKILSRCVGTRVEMIDIARQIGGSINQEFLNRVSLFPSTSIRQYQSLQRPLPDCILISSVVHHVHDLNGFLRDLKELVGQAEVTIIIADVEPGFLLSYLGYLSDRFVSGERPVRFIGREELRALMKQIFPEKSCRETNLFQEDKPNYCLIFS